MPIGWDHPDTARYYEAFCLAHSRYQSANEVLIAAAALANGLRVLDLAAGTGRAAELVIPYVCDITCFEPARAMRETGRLRLPRLRWIAELPAEETFDRVLCGAAIWQMLPIEDIFPRISDLLAPGGAFVLNIPSLYLGEPDPPGAGNDPHLYELAALLADGRTPSAIAAGPLPGPEQIERCLSDCGLHAHRWSARFRLTQASLRDWMKIPPLTDALLDGMSADDRAAAVDAAFARCDPQSWRWETWTGWTAWKT